MSSTAASDLRVGVIGLGRMGAPIARRLAGRFTTTVFDRDDARRGATAGVEWGASSSDVAANSEILLTVLHGPAEVEEVVREAGVFAALRPGSLWLDLGWADPAVADRLADEARDRGISSVAAPMQGGVGAAEAGTLRFHVAGDPAAIDRARPVLAALGDPDPRTVGSRLGQAHLLKLLANELWFGQVVAVAEALLTAGAAGIDPLDARRALLDGPAASRFLDEYGEAVIAGDRLPGFPVHRVLDELDAVAAISAANGIGRPLGDVVRDLHRRISESGMPVDDELAAARFIEQLARRRLTE